MKLQERVSKLQNVFDLLQATNSTSLKRQIIQLEITDELQDDFNYCLEVLAGKHMFGFKFIVCEGDVSSISDINTVRQYIEQLKEPGNKGNMSRLSILNACCKCYAYADFVEPIVNRTLRLGIGQSLLPKTGLSPMLAKKLDLSKVHLFPKKEYFITEKLDGNRCIAWFDPDRWCWRFQSRNGKEMNVNFSMGGLPVNFVYDGEILSPAQTENSISIHALIANSDTSDNISIQQTSFNKTSGLIRNDDINKDLVYNIFDIVDDCLPYSKRRELLNSFELQGKDVRILPVMSKFSTAMEIKEILPGMLSEVVNNYGEGLMINIGDASYSHKRTDVLLKYKEVQSMDMQVYNIKQGTGKYIGCVGSIECVATTPIGNRVMCSVGSGLSDEQRRAWSDGSIVGSIVEVEYFSLSQDKASDGGKYYSMRFPRLKKVRGDKTTTSTY